MKASAFRRWPVAGAYSPEQTTRLTGGSDLWFLGRKEVKHGHLIQMANPDAYDEKYAKWNMADLPIFGATTSMK